jgi:hypothetical protein
MVDKQKTDRMTRGLQWLSLDNAADCAIYDEHWAHSVHKRPHDNPGFLAMVKPEQYRAAAAVYRHGADAKVIYPFFYCELNELPHFRQIDRPLRHLVSPYGYGGALYEGDEGKREETSAAFDTLFGEELRRRGFISEFVREDLFSSRLALRSGGQVIEHQPNVVVRLDRPLDRIWKHYKNTVRTNIRRANEAGLQISFDPAGERIDDFIRVYYETMERRSASRYFFIPKERFQRLASTLGNSDGTMYLHVHQGNEVVASELLLLSNDAMYAFLSASCESAFASRPNDFMRHEAITWGHKHGYKWYVLGGGITPGDGIYRFKQAFDPGSVLPFRVRKVVHDTEAYEMLVKVRADHEERKGRVWEPEPDYFPAFLA